MLKVPNRISQHPDIKSLLLMQNHTLLIVTIKNFYILESSLKDEVLKFSVSALINIIRDKFDSHNIQSYGYIHIEQQIFIFSEAIDNQFIESLRDSIMYLNSDTSYQNIYYDFQLTYGALNSVDSFAAIYTKSLRYNNQAPLDLEKEYRLLKILLKNLFTDTVRFVYQPIVDSNNGSVIYQEYLMRIMDEKENWISAKDSIMLAERYGIINYVDEFVIRRAAKELYEFTNMNLSVNLSHIGLHNDKLLNLIIELFAGNEYASRFIIEITETAQHHNIEQAINFIDTVRSLGIRVAIDDFGIGFSSLNYISKVKYDIIKIDGSFIKNLENPFSKFIVELVIKLAKETGAKTVAEFVENGYIAKVLLDLKVDCMQGHFFSPPKNFRIW